MNLRREKLQDPRVREAIALMFNFEWSNADAVRRPLRSDHELLAELADGGLGPARGRGARRPREVPRPAAARDLHRARLRRRRCRSPSAPTAPRSAAPRSSSTRPAGRSAPGGLRVNDKGETLTIELIDDNPSFERIVNPFVQNLRQIGIDASYRLIDPAQMQERQKNFDYDIIPGRLVMSLSPSIELRTLFGSSRRQQP